MHPFYYLLALYACFGIAAFVYVLRRERNKFAAVGKAGAWLRVRLASLPILCAVAALVIIPVRGISGMEALGVFYLMLLTAAPLFWFCAHWLVGKFTQPVLNLQESAAIAASPLVLLIALAWLAQMLQPLAWILLDTLGLR